MTDQSLPTDATMPASPNSEPALSARSKFGLCALIALLTLIVYGRVVFFDFIPFDDPKYVQENYRLLNGLTAENLHWALTTNYAANWHPLTWMSYMIEAPLVGLSPGWMHFTNLLLHTANSVLLFLVLLRMTRAVGPSLFTALLFALHPLHVESVAWISERKDVLSTLFWILCMGAYVGYVRAPSAWRYALTGTLLFLGLMAKPMLVTVPCVFLLLDYWPLNRFGTLAAAERGAIRSAWRLFVEKLPLFAIVAIACVLTAIAQSSEGAVATLVKLSFPTRVANAAITYVGYLSKTFLPINLGAYYPHPGYTAPEWGPTAHFHQLAGASAAAILLASWIILRWGRDYKYLTVGWLWYLGTLVPVIGLMQVGLQGLADRYTYVPLIGIFIMVAWGVPDLLRNVASRRLLLDFFSVGTVAACLLLTWVQVGYWRNGETLFAHTVAVTENNTRAQGLLAISLGRRGRHAEAAELYRSALQLDPGNARYANFLGVSLTMLDKFDEADKCYRDSLAIEPNSASTHFNYGILLAKRDAAAAAIEHYEAALRLEPTMAKAHANLGAVLAKQRRFAEASAHYTAALRLNPQHRTAREELDRLAAHLPTGSEIPAPTTSSPNN